MASGNSRFQFLKNTSNNWASADTTLREGELGFETNFNRFKIGNNGLSWNKLNYASDSGIVGVAELEYPKADTKMATFISIKDPGYGAIGDGTLHFLNERYDTVSAARAVYGGTFITDITTQTIDWAALWKAMNTTNVQVLIPSGTYELGNNEIIINSANVNLYGVGNTSIITSSLKQTIITIQASSNLVFSDVRFTSTSTLMNDQHPVVHCYSSSTISNLIFNRCFFSSPNSNSNGFTAWTIVDTARATNIHFIQCIFKDCGRMGIEFVNHQNLPLETVYRFEGIVVDRCVFTNIGSKLWGMGVSLSGYGKNCAITNNIFDNVQLCIEIVGCSNTTIAYNKFRNFPAVVPGTPNDNASPLRMTGTEGRIMYNNYIVGNVCETPAKASTMVWLQRNSIMANNYWNHVSTVANNFESSRFDTRNNQGLWIFNDKFVSQDDIGIFLTDESSTGTPYPLTFTSSNSFTIGATGPNDNTRTITQPRTRGLSVGDTIVLSTYDIGVTTNNGDFTIVNKNDDTVIVTPSTFTTGAINKVLKVKGATSNVYFNSCTFDNSQNTRTDGGAVFQYNGSNTSINVTNCTFRKGSTRDYYTPSTLNIYLSRDNLNTLLPNLSIIRSGTCWKRTLIKNITSGNSITITVNAGTTATLTPLIITLRISSCTTLGGRFGYAERSYYLTQLSGITYKEENNIITASSIGISYIITGTSITFTIQNTASGTGTTYNFNINVSINSINIPIVT
jgi:hypothetical protein